MPGHPGLDRSLKSDHFFFVHGNWGLSDSHNLDNSRSRENGETIRKIEPAKQVAWEKRHIKFLHAIGPAPLALVKRQENLVASAGQLFCSKVFVSGPGLHGKPGVGLGFACQVHSRVVIILVCELLISREWDKLPP